MKRNIIFKISTLMTMLVCLFIVGLSKHTKAYEAKDMEKYVYKDHLYSVINNLNDIDSRDSIEKYASRLGGHAVYIESEDENEFVTDLIKKVGTKPYYQIGTHKFGKEWKYNINDSITYSNWTFKPFKISDKSAKYMEKKRQDIFESCYYYRNVYKKTKYYGQINSSGQWSVANRKDNMNKTGVIIEWDNSEDCKEIFECNDDVKVGEEFEVKITLNDSGDISRVLTGMEYDSSVLSITDVKVSDRFDILDEYNYFDENGRAFLLENKNIEESEDENILTIKFKALSPGVTKLSLEGHYYAKENKFTLLDQYDKINKFIRVN